MDEFVLYVDIIMQESCWKCPSLGRSIAYESHNFWDCISDMWCSLNGNEETIYRMLVTT